VNESPLIAQYVAASKWRSKVAIYSDTF